jgi:hypothetical protein
MPSAKPPRERGRILELPERFWNKVVITPTCWIWTGGRSHKYGAFAWNGYAEAPHKLTYRHFTGPIPDGPGRIEIHHLCENPLCCNPAHLVALTLGEHLDIDGRRELFRQRFLSKVAQRTNCAQGHAYTPENTYIFVGENGFPKRLCRICRARAARDFRRRRREDKEQMR